MDTITFNQKLGSQTKTIGGKKMINSQKSLSYSVKIQVIGDLDKKIKKNFALLHEHIDIVKEARDLINRNQILEIPKENNNGITSHR